ncbi:MAG: signal peptidase I [Ruminococcus sp.]|nr:signal peptidase I [Ruminococcus sp.]
MDNENNEKIEDIENTQDGQESPEAEKKFGEVSEEDIELAREAEPEDIKEDGPFDIKNEIIEWLESFVFAMFVVIMLFTFLFRIVMVDGGSMNDTLIDQDRLVLLHLNYHPERDDIVVINSTALNKTIIKRVIGLAGDKVVIDYNNNSVTVNGSKLSNEHIKAIMVDGGYFDRSYMTAQGVYEYEVPEGMIFVMGDNRNDSKDSRSIGFIEEDTVMGKAVFRLYPIGSFGKVD